MTLILGFAFSSLIVDPAREASKLPVMTSFSANDPKNWTSENVYIVVGIPLTQFSAGSLKINFFDVAKGVTVSGCRPTEFNLYEPVAQAQSVFYYSAFGPCEATGRLDISVNFTTISRLQFEDFDPRSMVQVILGHTNDTSAVIRHTEIPVVLTDGMNIAGFAHQYLVRQFKYPRLSVFGLFSPSENIVVSEITQIIPNGPQLTDHTASLTIFPRFDFSNVKIVQDHREKSILKGLSAIGGLWTFIAFIFGALYGNSLIRVVFGRKPIAVFGVVHSIVGAETQEEYRKTYPRLDADIKTLREAPGLMALIIDKLIDFEIISKPNLDVKDIESQLTKSGNWRSKFYSSSLTLNNPKGYNSEMDLSELRSQQGR